MSTHVTVRVILDDKWCKEHSESEVHDMLAWGLNCAGDAYQAGKTSGPVFTGNDGGARSPIIGSWMVKR